MTLLVTCGHTQRNNKFNVINYHFFSNDLDFDPITLTLKLDLDMVKIYLYTKHEVQQTDRSENITYLHLRVVNIHLHTCMSLHTDTQDGTSSKSTTGTSVMPASGFAHILRMPSVILIFLD